MINDKTKDPNEISNNPYSLLKTLIDEVQASSVLVDRSDHRVRHVSIEASFYLKGDLHGSAIQGDFPP